ncbi:hypothetical protein RD110_15560 [Rhodoferax koreense]|uniref:DUF4376 domain-containing protein n=1 Tax=Rhodoferax koreensis TaxID=1842727 RepID=A0A1P8JXF3_9BURK|nr:DUF4376 domain-containing protein [Rhodoferax koreense]APW38439.1 hypothetical protein RD110_15560 [Rhodoferax koreense]
MSVGRYAIYAAPTGPISRVLTAPLAQMQYQTSGTEQCALLDEGDDATHYMRDGLPVPYPTRPEGAYWTFDYQAGSWLDPRDLQAKKDARWAVIKAAREQAEFGGFAWDGSTFDSNAISQSRIQGAVLLAGMAPDFTITWTLSDNSTRLLDAAGMVAVGAALGVHVGTQFEIARQLRDAIYSATTPEAVAAVTWPA